MKTTFKSMYQDRKKALNKQLILMRENIESPVWEDHNDEAERLQNEMDGVIRLVELFSIYEPSIGLN